MTENTSPDGRRIFGTGPHCGTRIAERYDEAARAIAEAAYGRGVHCSSTEWLPIPGNVTVLTECLKPIEHDGDHEGYFGTWKP